MANTIPFLASLSSNRLYTTREVEQEEAGVTMNNSNNSNIHKND
jgi:hypothetical protein